MSEPIHWLPAAVVRERIVGGEVRAVDVLEAFLDRIRRHNGTLGAFVHVDPRASMAAAEAVDVDRRAGRRLGPLAGVPIAVKDNLCTRGMPTTCCSKILAGYRPPYDATVVERLRAAGAVVVGKTNMDEFAMGSSNENSAVGPVRNPWSLDRVPGGSSGGSAAAVAAGLAAGALGSDTGGSVRQPGGFCGLFALKPTYGRVSRYGLVAFASSLDQVGPLGRTSRCVARLLDVIGGHDPRDATSSARAVTPLEPECGKPVHGLRIGVVRSMLGDGVESGVVGAVEEALEVLRGLGCKVVDVELPHARLGVPVYYLVATAEASSNLARFDGVRYGLRVPRADLAGMVRATRAEGFGHEVRRRIMLGTFSLSAGYYDAFYLRAQKVRTLIARDFDAAFAGCDVLVTPTSPTVAFPIGARSADPLAMYLSDVCTLPASLAGIPALTVPCGLAAPGLPVGLQLIAPRFEEGRLLRLAAAYERLTPWASAIAEGFA